VDPQEQVSNYRTLDVMYGTYLALEELRHQSLSAHMDVLQARRSSVQRNAAIVLGTLIAAIVALFSFLPTPRAVIPGVVGSGVAILYAVRCYLDLKASHALMTEVAKKIEGFTSAPLCEQPRFILAEISSYRTRLSAAKEVLACEALSADLRQKFELIVKDWEDRISEVASRIQELRAGKGLSDDDYELIRDWLRSP